MRSALGFPTSGNGIPRGNSEKIPDGHIRLISLIMNIDRFIKRAFETRIPE